MTDPTPVSPWRHFRRVMAWMAVVAAATIAAALVVLHAEGVALRLHFVVALSLAIGVSVLLAGGLMGLVFASHRGGYDEGFELPETKEKGRPWERP